MRFITFHLLQWCIPRIFRNKARDQSTLFRIIEQESRGEAMYMDSSQGYS